MPNKKLTNKEKEKKRKEQGLGFMQSYLGLAGGNAGKAILSNVNDSGDLDGRIKLYHRTDKENVPSILENGIKGSKTNDNSFTKDIAKSQGVKPEQWGSFKNKSYLARNKDLASKVGRQRGVMATTNEYFSNMGDVTGAVDKDLLRKNIKSMKEKQKKIYNNQQTLKASIPKDKFKNLKVVDNPELLGAKTIDEYLERNPTIGMYPNAREIAESRLKNLGKDTVTIDGDFPSKYLKGGKGYVKNSPKEVLNYIKREPKSFAKGVGKGAVGLGLAGVGAYNTVKGLKRFKNAKKKVLSEREEKTAYEIVIDSFEKQAGFKENISNKAKDVANVIKNITPPTKEQIINKAKNITLQDVKNVPGNTMNALLGRNVREAKQNANSAYQATKDIIRENKANLNTRKDLKYFNKELKNEINGDNDKFWVDLYNRKIERAQNGIEKAKDSLRNYGNAKSELAKQKAITYGARAGLGTIGASTYGIYKHHKNKKEKTAYEIVIDSFEKQL